MLHTIHNLSPCNGPTPPTPITFSCQVFLTRPGWGRDRLSPSPECECPCQSVAGVSSLDTSLSLQPPVSVLTRCLQTAGGCTLLSTVCSCPGRHPESRRRHSPGASKARGKKWYNVQMTLLTILYVSHHALLSVCVLGLMQHL